MRSRRKISRLSRSIAKHTVKMHTAAAMIKSPMTNAFSSVNGTAASFSSISQKKVCTWIRNTPMADGDIEGEAAPEEDALVYEVSADGVASGIAPDHPFVQVCRKAGIPTFGSSTLSDQALMAFPSVKIGPGQSSRSHTADEFVRVDELEQAAPLYVRLLDGLIF